MPKSVTLTSSFSLTSTFWGFMSRGESTFSPDTVFKRSVGHALHSDVVDTVLRTSLVVDGDDVRVREGGRAPGLTPKALYELLVFRVLVPEDFERHLPVKNLVVGQVHLRHAPTPQKTLDNVTIVDKCPLHKAHTTHLRCYRPRDRPQPARPEADRINNYNSACDTRSGVEPLLDADLTETLQDLLTLGHPLSCRYWANNCEHR
jgi:hypothetical protein